jgi:hypothetical protein
MTSIISSMLKSIIGGNKSQEDENLPNIYVKDGVEKVRCISKLTDQELIKIIGYKLLERYFLIAYDFTSKYNKKISWDYVTRISLFYCAFLDEFLKRSCVGDYIDINSLRPYINKLKRPYTLSVTRGCIQVDFIINSADDSLSESDQQQYFTSMYNEIDNYIKEIRADLVKGSILSIKGPSENTQDDGVADNSNETCDEKEVLLEMSLRQRRV